MAIPAQLNDELDSVVAHFDNTQSGSIKTLWIVGPSGCGKSTLAQSAASRILREAFGVTTTPTRIIPKDVKGLDHLQRLMRSNQVLVIDECETMLRPGFEAMLSLLMDEIDRKNPASDHVYILIGYATTPLQFQNTDPGWRTRIGFVFNSPVPTIDVLSKAFIKDLQATYNDDNDQTANFRLKFDSAQLQTDPDFRRLAGQFLFRTAKTFNHCFYSHRNTKKNILSWRECQAALRQIVQNLGERLN